MKRIVLLILSLLLVLLCSCAGLTDNEASVNDASQASSSAEESSKPIKNWFDDDENASQNDESPIPSQPEEDEESSEESSEESEPETEIEIPEITVGLFSKDAKSQRIAFTKVSALSAKKCVTNPETGMTAIFDGEITRFFGAVRGEFDKAVYGKYLLPNGEEFEIGEIGLGYSENAFFSTVDAAVYHFDGTLSCFTQDSSVVCRKLETDFSLAENWLENKPIEIDESTLGKFGVVKNGRTVIPFEYDSISTYATEEEVGVYRCVKEGRTYYISSSGYNLTPDGYSCGSEPFGNRAWVYDGSQGYILEFK